MNLVRLLRYQAGVTQQVLANCAGTSQATIALYEGGAKSPTLTTLNKLAASVGLELFATYVPLLTREDRRSIAYHYAIVEKLRAQAEIILIRAKTNLTKLRKKNPHARYLLDQWAIWLKLPTEELVSRMLDWGIAARDMRQVSPFAGVLSSVERAKILKNFRKECGRQL